MHGFAHSAGIMMRGCACLMLYFELFSSPKLVYLSTHANALCFAWESWRIVAFILIFFCNFSVCCIFSSKYLLFYAPAQWPELSQLCLFGKTSHCHLCLAKSLGRIKCKHCQVRQLMCLCLSFATLQKKQKNKKTKGYLFW